MVFSVLHVWDGNRSTDQDSDFLSGAHFTLQSVPISGPWVSDLERVSKALVNTVTTSCLHRVLLVDKGLVCLFSCYTKWWSDRTKSWRGDIYSSRTPFCCTGAFLRRALYFSMTGQDIRVDLWLIDTCSLMGRGGVVLCENTLREGLAE